MEFAEALTRRRTGRPLSFDRHAALRQAMLAFWRSGYETTSIADLTAAMGITTPSLYTAFGDKRRLFLEAVRLYAGDPKDMARAIEAAPTVFDAARTLLTAAAHAYTGELTPRGCLLASATASGSAASVDVQKLIADLRGEIEKRLRKRVARDMDEGLLTPSNRSSCSFWSGDGSNAGPVGSGTGRRDTRGLAEDCRRGTGRLAGRRRLTA